MLNRAGLTGFVCSLAMCAGSVQAQLPQTPDLMVRVDAGGVALSWSDVVDADGYQLIYADYPEAATVGSLDLQAATSIAADLPVGSAYFVGVRAYNEQGQSLISNIDYFSVEAENSEAALCAVDSTDSRYAWPFAGVNGQDWVISNYVDRTDGFGISDYASAPGVSGKSYDGHNGIDIDIPTFREMDAGVDIYAIHDGTVVDVVDNFYDRETACVSNSWNVVTVRQTDGILVYYGHMRTDSAAVVEGQLVAKGDLLGQVGSSGCSTAAHLHLELRNGANAVVDPFFNTMWCDAPPYEPPVSVLTGILLESPANQYAEAFKDPPADLKSIALGSRLLPIMHSANGSIGDTVGVRLLRPDFSEHITASHTFVEAHRHGYWTWNTGIVDEAGVWTVQYLANGVPQYMLQIEVTP